MTSGALRLLPQMALIISGDRSISMSMKNNSSSFLKFYSSLCM